MTDIAKLHEINSLYAAGSGTLSLTASLSLTHLPLPREAGYHPRRSVESPL
jgi:hypothetical protein